MFDTSAPRDGVSVRKILCDDIDKIDENLSNQVEIQFDRVQLTLKDGELLNWAWGGDSGKAKQQWRNAFKKSDISDVTVGPVL